MRLIFTADSNRKYAARAIKAGMRYGARLPAKVYFEPYFVDQNWIAVKHEPIIERRKYMAALAQHKPALATVVDLEHEDEYDTVVSWAVEAARHVSEAVIIIPKVHGIIPYLPRYVRGIPVRLGYSVPTSHGGTPVPYQEFSGYDVHLLGGAPEKQLALSRVMQVVSADNNKIMEWAGRNQVWAAIPVTGAKNRRAPQLKEIGLGHIETDTCYEALQRSAEAFVSANDSGVWVGQLPLF